MGFRRVVGAIFIASIFISSARAVEMEDGTSVLTDGFVQLCRGRLGALSDSVLSFSLFLPKTTQRRFRGLSAYYDELSHSFGAVETLGSHDLWIDWGLGFGLAFSDLAFFRTRDGKELPQFIGIDIEETTHQRFRAIREAHPERVRFLLARAEELKVGDLPLASLATDVYGPLSYTPFFDVVLFNQLSHLRPGGIFTARIGKDTYFVDEQDKPIRIEDVLSRIKGVRIIHSDIRSQIAIERVEGELKIPLMQSVNFEPSLPPTRTFRVYSSVHAEFTESRP